MAKAIKLNSADRAYIARCAGRLHVSKTDRAVVRHFAGGVAKTWRARTSALTRATRKRVYREAIKAHARNRALYDRVMRGR